MTRWLGAVIGVAAIGMVACSMVARFGLYNETGVTLRVPVYRQINEKPDTLDLKPGRKLQFPISNLPPEGLVVEAGVCTYVYHLPEPPRPASPYGEVWWRVRLAPNFRALLLRDASDARLASADLLRIQTGGYPVRPVSKVCRAG